MVAYNRIDPTPERLPGDTDTERQLKKIITMHALRAIIVQQVYAQLPKPMHENLSVSVKMDPMGFRATAYIRLARTDNEYIVPLGPGNAIVEGTTQQLNCMLPPEIVALICMEG